MYCNAKSCVKLNGKLSEYFSCAKGVRQGENLSPILFAIYLNDFNEFISKNCNGLLDLSISCQTDLDVYLKMYVLLYADDTIILAENALDLQLALSSLHDYCQKWDLKVNVSKTKIVIFARGKVKKYPVFRIGDASIQVQDDYVYLGVTFNYNHGVGPEIFLGALFRDSLELQRLLGVIGHYLNIHTTNHPSAG